MPREILAAVAPERVRQRRRRRAGDRAPPRSRRRSRNTGPRCCGGTGPAAHRTRVGEHRPAERPRFERDHRQALVIRRHDQRFGGRQHVELVLIGHETEMADPRMRRNRHRRRADQHQIQIASRGFQVADGRNRRARRTPCSRRSVRRRATNGRDSPNFCLARCGSVAAGITEPTPTTTPGTSSLCARRLDRGALLERVVHDRADAAEDRLEDREPERRLALRRRHEHRALRDRARAVVRLVVAHAEQQDEIELAAPIAAAARGDQGSPALRCRASRAPPAASGTA